MDAQRRKQLDEFVAYVKTLDGDEKGEAQVFLDRLFRAFSRDGYKEAGATLEHRIRNKGGHTSFADLVWKPIVLIEMKKRGEDLAKHLNQAFDYWTTLVPNRPRYVVLCNFDQFRIYDFNQDINDPQDILTIDELPERYFPLNFLWPTNEKPQFKVDREKVTREAADLLAAVYKKLKSRREVGPAVAQRFILQTLVAFFSEDIGLLPRQFFTTLLDECVNPPKAFDLLDGLFKAMNNKEGSRGGRFKDVPYFNGGIFSESAAIELDPEDEIVILKNAATYNWAHISPDIFGTIFQHSMEAEERHALGAHYTSQQDIMKIVGPTIVQPFTTALDRCDTLKELAALRMRLQSLRVLDPACGSGNFLYIAYREMRRLEAQIVARENELSKKQIVGQAAFSHVSPKQFYGMDILPFAVELAKVTLSLAPKLAADELHSTEATLPLDNLDSNVVVKDALINTDGSRADWPAADVIIGNPPFLGAKRLKPERGTDYVNAVRKAYPEVPGMADYCVYWFRRAHDHVKPVTADDPYHGRVGLVGTQNIRNNQSRVGGLDHVVKSGVIVEAVENQPWSGEANVHVSIANWVKTPSPTGGVQGRGTDSVSDAALLIPEKRRLWSKVDPKSEPFKADDGEKRPKTVTRGKRGGIRKDKSFELIPNLVEIVSPSLSSDTDASSARILTKNEGFAYTGQYPRHQGFWLTAAQAHEMIDQRRENSLVVSPCLTGAELLTKPRPQRWVIDFQQRSILEAQSFLEPFEHLRAHTLPYIEEKAAIERKKTGKTTGQDQGWLEVWWQHFRPRAELVRKISQIGRYAVCARVTKRPVFAFLCCQIRPDNQLSCFVFNDDYSFGILQSDAHWQWFIAKCSKLKSDFRYTPESVFDTFPWPQSPTKKQIRTVADAGREIRRIRDESLPKIKGGLRALYRTLELPGKNPLKDAHAALDAAVLDAYGFSAKKDLLKQLLDLNLAVAAKIDRGEEVTAPGVPKSYGDPKDLITDDCIRP